MFNALVTSIFKRPYLRKLLSNLLLTFLLPNLEYSPSDEPKYKFVLFLEAEISKLQNREKSRQWLKIHMFNLL